MEITKITNILNWYIEEKDGKKYVEANWTEEDFMMVNGSVEYPPVLTKIYELDDPNCKWILHREWDFLKFTGEIDPNIGFEEWVDSIDYKEHIEKLADSHTAVVGRRRSTIAISSFLK